MLQQVKISIIEILKKSKVVYIFCKYRNKYCVTVLNFKRKRFKTFEEANKYRNECVDKVNKERGF